MVKAVGRLFKHLSDLSELFKDDETDLRLIRGAAIVEVVYIFGDASGLGFGSSLIEGVPFSYRFGVWNQEGYGTSSNYREFCNLVKILEEVGRKVNLQGKEVFLCTNSMVLDSIALFDLVVRIHCLSMRFKCNARFIRVAGTRIISQGKDGLSRGDIYEGIMKGETMPYFIPLEQLSLARSPALSKWIKGWASTLGREVEVLYPAG